MINTNIDEEYSKYIREFHIDDTFKHNTKKRLDDLFLLYISEIQEVNWKAGYRCAMEQVGGHGHEC